MLYYDKMWLADNHNNNQDSCPYFQVIHLRSTSVSPNPKPDCTAADHTQTRSSKSFELVGPAPCDSSKPMQEVKA